MGTCRPGSGARQATAWSPGVDEVTCVDATHAWVVDHYDGVVIVTSDGGNTWNWNSVYPPSNDGE